jgi:hypothetical protein
MIFFAQYASIPVGDFESPRRKLFMNREIDYRRKPVLIVECDSAKLARENLSVGDGLYSKIQMAFPRNPISLVCADTEAGLLKQLGTLAETKRKKPYNYIIIIGHSNKRGLQITSDRFAKWDGVASWFRLFAPRRIALLACEAGRWLPSASLFDGIPSLKEIFGSPVPAHKDQLHFILLSVLHTLGVKEPDKGLIRLMQIANFAITKGLIFRNTRSDYERGGSEEGALWTLGESVISQLIDRMRGNSM